jgi:hypothetical protein
VEKLGVNSRAEGLVAVAVHFRRCPRAEVPDLTLVLCGSGVIPGRNCCPIDARWRLLQCRRADIRREPERERRGRTITPSLCYCLDSSLASALRAHPGIGFTVPDRMPRADVIPACVALSPGRGFAGCPAPLGSAASPAQARGSAHVLLDSLPRAFQPHDHLVFRSLIRET